MSLPIISPEIAAALEKFEEATRRYAVAWELDSPELEECAHALESKRVQLYVLIKRHSK